MFLTALANCPDLESLKLIRPGPDPLNDYPNQCDVVVQLCKLRELSLDFGRASMTGCVLSHIRYPESAYLELGLPVDGVVDVSEAISQALPRSNADVLRPFKRTRELTIHLDLFSSIFSTDKSIIRCWHWATGNSSQRLSRSIRKVLEIVGKAVIALSIEAQHVDLTGEMWESFLHGFPLLEQIRWRCVGVQKSGVADPFVFAFSRPFEGELVCPQLMRLDLPKETLAQNQSAALLKRALTERKACGVRLESMGFGDEVTLPGDRLALEGFLDLVGEVW